MISESFAVFCAGISQVFSTSSLLVLKNLSQRTHKTTHLCTIAELLFSGTLYILADVLGILAAGSLQAPFLSMFRAAALFFLLILVVKCFGESYTITSLLLIPVTIICALALDLLNAGSLIPLKPNPVERFSIRIASHLASRSAGLETITIDRPLLSIVIISAVSTAIALFLISLASSIRDHTISKRALYRLHHTRGKASLVATALLLAHSFLISLLQVLGHLSLECLMQTKLAPFIFTFAFFKLLSFILLVYTVKMDDISLISPSGFFFTSVLKIFFAVTLDSKYLSFTAFSHWVAAVYILIGFVMCAFLVYLQLIDDSRNLNETTENPQVPAQSAPDALQHELPIIKVLPSSTHLRMDPLNNTRLSCLVPQFSMSLISSLPFDDDSDDDLDDHIDGDSQQMRIKDDSDRRKEKKKERRMETLRRNEELMKKTSSSSFDSPLTFCDSISFEEEHADLAEDYLRYFYPDRRSGAEGM